ncbi:MAG TPA: alpha/beta fold hydrolase [Thermoanaerobaculia bacterium]
MRGKKKAGDIALEPVCRVVRFGATDGIELAGLLYEPERQTDHAAMFLHGTGGASVFEARRTNLLAAELLAGGIAFFPFNNRGAHLLRRLRFTESHVRAEERRGQKPAPRQGGMAHEVIRECVHDIDGAMRELRRRGYRRIDLIGHSTGANKIAVYDHYKPRNQAGRYVLLAGGDDTGLLYSQLGARRFSSALLRARTMIRARRGDELVPRSLSSLPMSWRSFYDMANPDGDYNVFPFLEAMQSLQLSRRPRFRFLRAMRKPVLLLYGENDEYCHGDVSRSVAALAEAVGAKTNVEIAIMSAADHGFSGRERDLGRLLVSWLSDDD